MNGFDYVILALGALVLIYQLMLMLRLRTQALIRGQTPNKRAVLVMLAILAALAVWRMGDLSQRWPVVAVLIAACAVFALCGTGITGRGVIGGGRQITFARAAYYTIEGENTENPTFRISRITRELSLNVAKEDIPRIRALMEENGVATFEEFQEKVEKKTRSRQNAQHKKKKNK